MIDKRTYSEKYVGKKAQGISVS